MKKVPVESPPIVPVDPGPSREDAERLTKQVIGLEHEVQAFATDQLALALTSSRLRSLHRQRAQLVARHGDGSPQVSMLDARAKQLERAQRQAETRVDATRARLAQAPKALDQQLMTAHKQVAAAAARQEKVARTKAPPRPGYDDSVPAGGLPMTTRLDSEPASASGQPDVRVDDAYAAVLADYERLWVHPPSHGAQHRAAVDDLLVRLEKVALAVEQARLDDGLERVGELERAVLALRTRAAQIG